MLSKEELAEIKQRKKKVNGKEDAQKLTKEGGLEIEKKYIWE